MAEKQAGGLSLKIGLTLSELQSDFISAAQTIRQGIEKLNRQQNIVRLRMEADVAGLDAVSDKTKIIEVREQALNQLLEMQKDRLILATKAFQDYTNGKNANEIQTKRLEAALERERLAVARLEAELRTLSAQKISIDTGKFQSEIEKITSKIQNIRLKAEIDTSRLQEVNSAFDNQKIHIAAVTKELELQRQKLLQLRAAMYQAAQNFGTDNVLTLNIKSNVLSQIKEISRLETKLKDLANTNINLQIRTDSLQQAEKEISEKISRLNARIENIRIKAELDTSKISGAAAEFDKAKVQAQAFTRELGLQEQKLLELKRLLGQAISVNGLHDIKTINLHTDIQRQIQEINQLKAKLEELYKVTPPKKGLLDDYLNIKGTAIGHLNNITTALGNLRNATSSADNALVSVLGVIDSLPNPAAKAVAALAGVPIVFKGIENSIVDLLKASAASGDAVYVMSRGFQMSIAETGKFTAICKTAGVEVNDLAGTIRRMQAQIIRGGEDAKAEKWLRRYGESAFDANGHLKDLNGTTLTLSRALKKAQAEGNGMAFILGTVRTASADAITAIEDAESVYEQASRLVKTGLADPTFAHEVQGNINELNTQISFTNASFKTALLPVANEIVPKLSERMERLTQIIADNKEVIRDFGRVGAEAFMKIEEVAEIFIEKTASIAKFFNDLRKNPHEQEIILKYKNDFEIKTLDDLIKKEQPKSFEVIKENSRLYAQVKAIYEPIFVALKDVQEEILRENKKIQKALGTLSNADLGFGAERRALEQNPEILANLREARKIQEEADKIYSSFGRSEYENKIAEVQKWRNEVLRDTAEEELSLEKRAALENLYSAKLAQIKQEQEQKLSGIRERISSAEKTELEKRISEIEREKESWIKTGMEKAEAEKLAQKELTDYIKNTEKELSDSLQSLYNTELENRLAQIEKEKQAWIDKCGDEVKATQKAEQAKADAMRSAAMSVIRQQAEEYEAYQKGGYAGLRAYKANQLAEQGINSNFLYMTPQQLADFQKANQVAEKSMLPNFMTEHDRAEHAQQMQDWREWQAMQNKNFDAENYVIVNGIKTGLSEILNGTEFTVGKNNSEESHTIKLSPEGDSYTKSDDKYSYDKNGKLTQHEENVRQGELPTIDIPENYLEILQPLRDVSESLSEFPTATQNATESLNELPTAVQGVMENLQQLSEINFSDVVSNFEENFSQIPTFIQEALDFTSLNETFSEVTVRINDLGSALENFLDRIINSEVGEQKTPVAVTTNLSIEEAHAWDYDHIAELAEKVADILRPAIIGAIGGDDNAY